MRGVFLNSLSTLSHIRAPVRLLDLLQSNTRKELLQASGLSARNVTSTEPGSLTLDRGPRAQINIKVSHSGFEDPMLMIFWGP